MNYLEKKKKAMLNYVSGGRLPSAYQEVEWIGTVGDGQEYIVLEQRHNFVQYDDFIIGVETTTTSTADQGFCGVVGNAEAYFKNGKFIVWNRYSSSQSGMTIQPYAKYDIEWYTNTNTSTTQNFLLFAYRPDMYFFTGKIYYFQWLRDNQLLLDLVPCYRKSDNEIGMYDLVNDTFFTNRGTGTFTKGNDV